MNNISYSVAFSAGLFSFFSPCVLPMVPVYFASMYSPESFNTQITRHRFPILLHSLSFVAGFTLVLIILGLGAGLVGSAVSLSINTLRTISGVIFVAAGVFTIAALFIPRLNFEKRLTYRGKVAAGYSRSFLIGVVFSLAWTPCVGPVLGSILALAWFSNTPAQGSNLMALYAVGFALPFLIIGAASDYFLPLLKRINHYSHIILAVSGIFLLTVGVLILTNRLTWLQRI